ncbi:hypothetical protein PoB_005922500 [Plakobranchus ocellatus]|uniref:Uncharacterized protein n=1 Tax=Plakobranchus ocellatus TaxID=259542 RepID=A0AAV4CL87_9GAST|nr:hypothetical protein PoB_005922500 [Plakobranchus ocellatus]
MTNFLENLLCRDLSVKMSGLPLTSWPNRGPANLKPYTCKRETCITGQGKASTISPSRDWFACLLLLDQMTILYPYDDCNMMRNSSMSVTDEQQQVSSLDAPEDTTIVSKLFSRARIPSTNKKVRSRSGPSSSPKRRGDVLIPSCL